MKLRNTLPQAGFWLALLTAWQLAALSRPARLRPLAARNPQAFRRGARLAPSSTRTSARASARALPGLRHRHGARRRARPCRRHLARFDRLLSPVVFLTYPVPKIVMLPIFMLWFGIGDLSKVLIIALACFYPVFINAYYGARATPQILVWSALNMGAGALARLPPRRAAERRCR